MCMIFFEFEYFETIVSWGDFLLGHLSESHKPFLPGFQKRQVKSHDFEKTIFHVNHTFLRYPFQKHVTTVPMWLGIFKAVIPTEVGWLVGSRWFLCCPAPSGIIRSQLRKRLRSREAPEKTQAWKLTDCHVALLLHDCQTVMSLQRASRSLEGIFF